MLTNEASLQSFTKIIYRISGEHFYPYFKYQSLKYINKCTFFYICVKNNTY